MPCCTDDGRLRTELLGDDQCLPIVVPPNDPDYVGVECLAFIRGSTDLDSGCSSRRGPAEQVRPFSISLLHLTLSYLMLRGFVKF